MVLVYPVISWKVLSPDALTRLAEYPRAGDTLIGAQVLGGGLNQVFGFHDAMDSRQQYDIRLSEKDLLLASFTEPRERQLRVGVREHGIELFGTCGYTESATPLAVFEDGTAAITQKAYTRGRAYAIGLDLGFLLLKGYNSRADEIVRPTTISSTPHSMSSCGLPIRARGGDDAALYAKPNRGAKRMRRLGRRQG